MNWYECERKKQYKGQTIHVLRSKLIGDSRMTEVFIIVLIPLSLCSHRPGRVQDDLDSVS